MRPRITIMSDIDGTVLNTPQEEAWYQASAAWDLIGTSPEERERFSDFYPYFLASVPALTGAAGILKNLKNRAGKTYYDVHGTPTNGQEDYLAKKLMSEKDAQYSELIAAGKYEVYGDVTSMLVDAKRSSYKVLAVSASRSAEMLLSRIPGPKGTPYDTLLQLFDAHALGVTKEKAENKYRYAYDLHQAIIDPNGEGLSVIVFEDGLKGVKCAADAGFDPVGVCRKTTSGRYLCTTDDMLRHGAKVALAEDELRGKNLQDIIREVYRG